MHPHKFKKRYFYSVLTCILALLCACSLFSCGYQWGDGGLSSSYRTISVPYVEGDWNGDLTAAIVQQISQTGTLKYRVNDGDLILIVSVVDERDQDIGFRYDRKKDGKFRSRIIPDETRIFITAEMKVMEAISGTIILGPVRITADVDFDHDYYSTRGGVNIFSLGQLTDEDEAREAAHVPLNRRLAKKIVDYVNDYW